MNTVRKIKKVITCGMCLLIMTLAFFILGTNRVWAYMSEKTDKIYSDAILDDDFCDSSIIVILDEDHSKIDTQSNLERKLYTTSSNISNIFDGVDVSFIKDLTALPENGATLYNGEQFNVGELRQYLEEKPFKQILHVGLGERSKQNVLNLISKIEKIEGVRYVGPNFILSGASSNPNDPRLGEQWALGNDGIRARQAIIACPFYWILQSAFMAKRYGIQQVSIEEMAM